MQAFREDRTLIAAADYIADALGQRFVESVPLNMERAWAESHPKCPLICLLSPGADPTKLIEVGLTGLLTIQLMPRQLKRAHVLNPFCSKNGLYGLLC